MRYIKARGGKLILAPVITFPPPFDILETFQICQQRLSGRLARPAPLGPEGRSVARNGKSYADWLCMVDE